MKLNLISISMLKVIVVSAIISMVFSAKMKTNTGTRLSTLNLLLERNNMTSATQFKAHVMLDEKDRGFIISPSNLNSPEKYIRLVGEKQDGYEDTYLLDYRLMRTCDFNLSFSDDDATSLNVLLSPRSLENRGKNVKFDLKVELVDYNRMFPGRKMSDVKKILKSKCEKRKEEIDVQKNQFVTHFEKLRNLRKNLNAINDKLNKEINEVGKYSNSIIDAKNQISSIAKLNSSYTTQLNSIKAISTSSNRLISSTTIKLAELNDNLKSVENEIKNLSNSSVINEELISKYRNDLNSILNETKSNENYILNLKKNISMIETEISNVNFNKMKVDLEIRQKIDILNKTNENMFLLENDIQSYKKELNETLLEIEKKTKEKKEIEVVIENDKLEINDINSKINLLLQQKYTLEQRVINEYEKVRNKQNEIITMSVKSNDIQTKMKILLQKHSGLKDQKENELDRNITNFNNENKQYEKALYEKKSYLQLLYRKLENLSKDKVVIGEKLEKINAKIKEVKLRNDEMEMQKNDLETKKNYFISQIKDKEKKIENLKLENEEYENEVNTINRKISSSVANIKNLNSMIEEYEQIKKPYDQKIENIKAEKNAMEAKVVESINQLKGISNIIKTNVKSARVLVDLAEDEALSKMSDGKDVEAIIKKIIN